MFEIHTTVTSNDIVKFKEDCHLFGCKPLLIELQNNNSSYQQLMTSQKFNHQDWETEISKVNEFFGAKYKVDRIKVEVNPYVQIGVAVKYYETHFRILVSKDRIEKLDSIIHKFGFHKSRNVFKIINGEIFYQMATYRSYEIDLVKFEGIITEFKKELTTANFIFDKIELEACIIDTNDSLDAKWLKKKV